MPVIELATFQASEALLANPDLALGALEILKNSEGFLGYDENPSIHLIFQSSLDS